MRTNVVVIKTKIRYKTIMSHRYALLQAEAEILALEARAQAFIALGCDADAKAPKVDSP